MILFALYSTSECKKNEKERRSNGRKLVKPLIGFSTWLRRNGMPREFIRMLRGDSKCEAIDIYDHIKYEELQRKYIECIPRLGV